MKFISCHKDIVLNDYCDNFKRLIPAERKNAGDGLKQIVPWAFTVDSNIDSTDIILLEAQYHMRDALFCCSLTSRQQKEYSILCNMMTCMFSSVPSIENLFNFRPQTNEKEIDRYN